MNGAEEASDIHMLVTVAKQSANIGLTAEVMLHVGCFL
jgi:hypothetical protein